MGNMGGWSKLLPHVDNFIHTAKCLKNQAFFAMMCRNMEEKVDENQSYPHVIHILWISNPRVYKIGEKMAR